VQQVLVPSKEAAKGYFSSKSNIYFAAANMADIISSCEMTTYSFYVNSYGHRLQVLLTILARAVDLIMTLDL
jgi:hypothetical protein